MKSDNAWSKKGKHDRDYVEGWTKQIAEILTKNEVEQFEFCGSFRRQKKIIGDIDCIVNFTDNNHEKFNNLLSEFEKIGFKKLVGGSQKASYLIDDKLQIDIREVDKKSWLFMLAIKR